MLLDPESEDCVFPDVTQALREPNGLLAVGGRLSPDCLLRAYRRGIFPWYSEEQPILWWSPDPRMVLFPDELRISRSLRKTLRRGIYRVSVDRAFPEVIAACAAPRRDEPGTWITAEMEAAYCHLHREGWAHSVEVWAGDALVGGLYGVAIGRVFFGESMFHRRRDASKVALVSLVERLRQWHFALIDCQVASDHLATLGAREIPRAHFIELLDRHCPLPGWPADGAAVNPERRP
ncbi:MAG TPA: leucyl/phenylalanyl-tRNA--protein transferase [Gammaproteobacteria bacterium]|nr:leucyl/phenylalanyl-tRNA--protein transferase [Gammaproteobacteria bacterium]